MNTPTFSESTTFTRDVEGRFICNTLDEAKASMDTGKRPDALPQPLSRLYDNRWSSGCSTATPAPRDKRAL